MKEIKKWILLAILMFIPLAGIVLVNVTGDMANLFHSGVNDDIAFSILDGNATYGVGVLDERRVKRVLIENLPQEVDTLAIGPSLIMCLNKDIVGTDSFYNLGESGADYYDILAQFGLLKTKNIKYKRIIFCADFDFLNKGRRAIRHNAYMPYAEYMLSVLDGNEGTLVFPESEMKKIKFREKYTAIRQLVSIQYFQGTAKLFYDQIIYNGKRYGIVTPENADKYFYYDSDASWNYDLKSRNKTEDYVVKDAIAYVDPKKYGGIINQFCGINEHLSDDVKETFSSLMNYLQSQGVEVLIFLCPLSPALYDLYDQELRPLLPESEAFILNYAKEHNIRVTGSYNPYSLNMSNSDFYDARHVRREKLGQFFEFETPNP